jgi:hypothetical protein
MMRIASRAEWGAATEAQRPYMRLPVAALWLHHSVTPVTIHPYSDMRAIQRIGISRFGYISYSYAIHPKGTILEGQGLRIGAHTAGRNSTSFGVVLIGNYDQRQPTSEQVDAFRWLRDHLITEGHLKPGIYPTGGHRDVAATACPGNKAHALLDEFRQAVVPPAPPMEVPPMYNPPVSIVSPVVATLKSGNGGCWMLCETGHIYAWEGAPFLDMPAAHPEYWGARKAARLEPLGAGYRVVATNGQFYEYPGPV